MNTGLGSTKKEKTMLYMLLVSYLILILLFSFLTKYTPFPWRPMSLPKILNFLIFTRVIVGQWNIHRGYWVQFGESSLKGQADLAGMCLPGLFPVLCLVWDLDLMTKARAYILWLQMSRGSEWSKSQHFLADITISRFLIIKEKFFENYLFKKPILIYPI